MPKFDNFAKIAHKMAKLKYFINIENESDSPINSILNDYILCWGQLIRPSKMVDERRGPLSLSLILRKCVHRLCRTLK